MESLNTLGTLFGIVSKGLKLEPVWVPVHILRDLMKIYLGSGNG